MADSMRFWIGAALLGAGATAFMDLGGAALQRLAGLAPPDYGLVGRWVGHMPARFRHEAIARAPAVRGERALGWAVHYAVGIAFAALLLALCGVDWLRAPTPGIALAFGLVTVVAPFVLMQPAMGAGLAGSLTPDPTLARARSLLNHALFGAGLFVAASVIARFLPTLSR